MEVVAGDRRVKAFRATDAFTLEAYRACQGVASRNYEVLVKAIRRSAIRSGGALVAASTAVPGGVTERRLLEQARTVLAESRYYIYVARRIGLFDVKKYRGLTSRQDVAMRELDALLRPASDPEQQPP